MSTEHRAQSTEASYTYKLLVLTSSILFLTACGGSSSSSPTPQTKTFKVSANVASGEGTVTPTQQSIEQGKTTTLNLSPKDGYQIASATGCNGTLKNNVYTTGAINADCQVQVSFEEKIATINTLEAKVEVKQEVQLLSADVTQNLAIAGNKLTFVGNPKLKVGDVFVANEIAYKVEAIGGSASATEIITSEPSLNDIYDEIEISGEFNDYAEFIPVTDNTPIVQARSANARVITAASNSTSTTERFELLSKSNKNGFSVSKYTVEIEKGVLKTTGTIDTGLIVKADKWKVLSGEGSANIDMYIEPTIEIAFTKSQSVFDQAAQDNGVCMGIGGNSAALKNKRAEKLGPGRYLLGYMQFPVTTPIPVRIRVPVCVAVNAEANAEFKLLEFTGKATIKTGLGKSSTISSTNNLKLNVPNKNATVPDGEPVTDASTSTTVLKKTVGIKGLVSFPEISVEIVDASGYIAGVGVMVSPIAEASLTGTVPALTVNTDFNKLSVGDPELCLTLEGKGTLRGKGFVDFFWTKGTPLQVKHSHEFFKETKKWGLCKEEEKPVIDCNQTFQLPYNWSGTPLHVGGTDLTSREQGIISFKLSDLAAMNPNKSIKSNLRSTDNLAKIAPPASDPSLRYFNLGEKVGASENNTIQKYNEIVNACINDNTTLVKMLPKNILLDNCDASLKIPVFDDLPNSGRIGYITENSRKHINSFIANKGLKETLRELDHSLGIFRTDDTILMDTTIPDSSGFLSTQTVPLSTLDDDDQDGVSNGGHHGILLFNEERNAEEYKKSDVDLIKKYRENLKCYKNSISTMMAAK